MNYPFSTILRFIEAASNKSTIWWQ